MQRAFVELEVTAKQLAGEILIGFTVDQCTLACITGSLNHLVDIDWFPVRRITEYVPGTMWNDGEVTGRQAQRRRNVVDTKPTIPAQRHVKPRDATEGRYANAPWRIEVCVKVDRPAQFHGIKNLAERIVGHRNFLSNASPSIHVSKQRLGQCHRTIDQD